MTFVKAALNNPPWIIWVTPLLQSRVGCTMASGVRHLTGSAPYRTEGEGHCGGRGQRSQTVWCPDDAEGSLGRAPPGGSLEGHVTGACDPKTVLSALWGGFLHRLLCLEQFLCMKMHFLMSVVITMLFILV